MTWAREKIGKPYFYDPLRREWAIIPGKNPLENALVGELGGCRSFTAIPEGGDSALPALHIAKKYINGGSVFPGIRGDPGLIAWVVCV